MQPTARKILSDPVHLLAFGLGTGLMPRAPGTAGTFLAVLIEPWLRIWGLPVRVAIVALAFAFGVWLTGASASRLDSHDHPGIVWDEIVGYWATMLVAPPGWGWMVLGFALFRLFDILKPWPIRDVDHRIRGGLGIMLDDLVAAAFAALILLGLQGIVHVLEL